MREKIKDEIVWTTIQKDLQPLKDKINSYLNGSNNINVIK